MNQSNYIIQTLQYWLKFIIPVALLMAFFDGLLFPMEGSFPISEYNFWNWANQIGAKVGIAGFIVGIGFKSLFNQKALIGAWLVGIFSYLFLRFTDSEMLYNDVASNLISTLAPVGIAGFLLGGFDVIKNKNYILIKIMVLMTLLVIGMSIATENALTIVAHIFPNSHDIIVYKLDTAFSNSRQQFLLDIINYPEWFKDFISGIYDTLTLFLFLVFALVVRENKAIPYNIIRVMVVPFGLAFLCYAVVPISGPFYTFNSEQFPNNMPSPSVFDAVVGFIPPAPRNGMPSMHFTGAFLIWLLTATLNKKYVFYFATVFLLLTITATIGTGEHYLLDLVVAMPFAIALGLYLISPKGWYANKSTQVMWKLAIATFAFWMVSMLAIPAWLTENIWFVRLLAAWSVIVCVYLTSVYLRLVWRADTSEQIAEYVKNQEILSQSKSAISYPKWAIGAFVVSGFAGLLYEVVYAKSLAITFGSTSLASNTVLVTYMGGMALGAWIGGIYADKVKKPLMWYVGVEAVIGLYAVLTPLLFKLIQALYLSLAVDLPPDAQILTVYRVGLGVLVLGIPTLMMGATVPFMFKYLRQFGVTTESAVSQLYSANVVGAALGSLVGAYVLLPTLGRLGATNLAAAISLLLALYVMEQAKKMTDITSNADNQIINNTTIQRPAISKAVGIMALLVLMIGGGITLGLEVVSIHMLAVVAGNSVYAFGLMLATFLTGLSVGSIAGKQLLEKLKSSYVVILAQCGVCISIILTGLLWDKIPMYFSSFGAMQQYVPFGFGAREVIRGAVCAIAMFPAAFFIGINYPAAMSLASDWLSAKGEAKSVGVASALNTLGNISGVLIVAFFALPTFGSNRVFIALAFLAFALAVMMFVVDVRENNKFAFGYRTVMTTLIASFAVFFVYPKHWDFNRLSQGANVYFMPAYWGDVIDYTESITGGITSVTKDPKSENLTLLTNGKFQGNNTGEVEAQESLALIPLLHTDKRDNALVIGYGTGMSARVLHDQQFKQLDIAELSKDIVHIADKYFPDNNMGVSSKPNVNMYYTDGRNYLLTQNKKYDLISMEISSIWFAGAANLYNKEFYQLAKSRLHEDGILQQWVQLHHMYAQDLIYILNTVRSEFQYVWLYESGGQGIIVASNSQQATNYHVLKPPYHNLTAEQLKTRSEELVAGQVLTPKGVDNLARKFDPSLRRLISTDNNLRLEYSTPKGNAIIDDEIVNKNIQFLHQFEQE